MSWAVSHPQDVEEEVVVLEKDLERGLKSFGRGFTG